MDTVECRLTQKVALTDLTYPALQSWLASLGEPAYRAQQIHQWIYRALATDFAQMTNLPEKLQDKLAEAASIAALRPLAHLLSPDGQTEKVLFELSDGQTIEGVLMLYDARQTVCVSTQVGCPIGCPFCATGRSGFCRNLTSGEIVDQVLHFARLQQAKSLHITNVVLMGMGEPLLNYEAMWQAIETLHDARGFDLGARHFTISTAGVIPGIERLAQEALQVGLAVSLHAADDALRDQLLPLNKKYPLHELIPACRRYVEQTRRRITFEYALIDRVNDEPAQARQLVHLLKGMLCHVNLIPLNPGGDGPYTASPRPRVLAFQNELKRGGIANTLRVGRGVEIKAGCGELRSRKREEYQP